MTEKNLTMCNPCGNGIILAIVRDGEQNRFSEVSDHPIRTQLKNNLDGGQTLEVTFNEHFLKYFNLSQILEIFDALSQAAAEIDGHITISVESLTPNELDRLHTLTSSNLRNVV